MSENKKIAFYDVNKVKASADGRWIDIFDRFVGSQLSVALSKKPGTHVDCPKHQTSNKNGKGDGFRFFKDVNETGGAICNTCGTFHDGLTLIQWLTNQDFREVLNSVAEYLGVDEERLTGTHLNNAKKYSIEPSIEDIQRKKERDKKREDQSKKSTQAIEKLWAEADKLDSGLPQPMYRYFKHRSILLRKQFFTGDHLRFHPKLPYYEENEDGDYKCLGHYPAIVAAIRNLNGEIITLHRTYLEPSGYKANVEAPRKMMTVPADLSVTGSAIQLGGFPKDGVLGVAEGLETALSITKIYQIPTWSLVNTSLLKNFLPPENIHTLLIWGDKDKSEGGQLAAESLKESLSELSIKVKILIPNRPILDKSVDWNDILIKEGISGFPAPNIMSRLLSN